MPGLRYRLALFVREPVAGRVKTRLASRLGPEGAAALYRAFLEDLASSLPGAPLWEAVAVHDGPVPGPGLRALFRGDWEFRPQGDGDLGRRLARCFEESAELGVDGTVIAGSDVPTLTSAEVAGAFGALPGFRGVAFAPSPDGGFALVGLSAGVPVHFLRSGIAWSSGSTLEDAIAAAERSGLDVRSLPPVPDIDEEKDLGPLGEFLRLHPAVAPATRAALGRMGLLAAPAGAAGR